MYGTFEGVPYVEHLEEVTAIQLVGWTWRILDSSAGVTAANRVIVFHRAQIFAEFRYSRRTDEYWTYVKEQRRICSIYGKAARYRCLTHIHLLKRSRQQGLVKLHRLFGRIEGFRGCYAELPPVFL